MDIALDCCLTSGIKDYLNVVQPTVARQDFTYERIVELVADLPLDFEPGERFRYSNSNYILLAMLIQTLSGRSYDSFLVERVWVRWKWRRHDETILLK